MGGVLATAPNPLLHVPTTAMLEEQVQKVKGYLYRPSPRHCHVDEGIHIPWKDNIPTNAYSVLTFE